MRRTFGLRPLGSLSIVTPTEAPYSLLAFN